MEQLLINISSGESGDLEMALVDHGDFAWIFGVPTTQRPGSWRLAWTRATNVYSRCPSVSRCVCVCILVLLGRAGFKSRVSFMRIGCSTKKSARQGPAVAWLSL